MLAAHAGYDVDDDSRLRDLLWLLWVRRGSVMAVLVVAVGAVFTHFAGEPKIYRSTAEVLVRPLAQRPGAVDIYELPANMEPARRVAASEEVRRLVEQRLGYELSDHDELSVDAPEDSNTLLFKALSTSPVVAQQMAATYVDVYLNVRRQQLLEDLADALKPIERHLADVVRQMESAQESLLYAVEPERSSIIARYTDLLGLRRSLEEQRNALNAPELRQVGRVLKPATRPKSPVGPDPKKVVAIALLLGVGLGAGQAILRSRIAPRIQGRRDLVEEAGLPVLAMVQKVPRRRRGAGAVVETEGKAADGYQALAATVLWALQRGGLRSLLLTCPAASEVRTPTVVNLAALLTGAGKRVVLLATGKNWLDLECLLGADESYPGPRPLVVRAKGTAAGKASVPGLISVDDVRRTLRQHPEADLVLVDAPPVVGRFETLAIAPLVDATVILVAADRTTRAQVRNARLRLEQAGARMFGAVLSEVSGARIWFERRFEPLAAFPGLGGGTSPRPGPAAGQPLGSPG